MPIYWVQYVNNSEMRVVEAYMEGGEDVEFVKLRFGSVTRRVVRRERACGRPKELYRSLSLLLSSKWEAEGSFLAN